MTARAPLVIMVAGPNGAGKSTMAARLLQDALTVSEFVNADPIASGLSAFRPQSVAMAAGRVMLARMKALAEARQDTVVDSWRMFDNSAATGPLLIAFAATRQPAHVVDVATWNALQESY